MEGDAVCYRRYATLQRKHRGQQEDVDESGSRFETRTQGAVDCGNAVALIERMKGTEGALADLRALVLTFLADPLKPLFSCLEPLLTFLQQVVWADPRYRTNKFPRRWSHPVRS